MITFSLIFFTVLLAECYSLLSNLLGCDPWVAAATINSFLTIGIWFRRSADPYPGPKVPKLEKRLLPWAGVFVIAIVGLMVALPMAGNPTSRPIAMQQWAWVVWPPIVEEMVFRRGLFTLLHKRWTLFASLWSSALVFSALHGMPTLERIFDGQVGLPLGPFFLGICCGWILHRTGSVVHAITFHSACNLTPIIMQKLGPNWLEILDFLYLKMT